MRGEEVLHVPAKREQLSRAGARPQALAAETRERQRGDALAAKHGAQIGDVRVEVPGELVDGPARRGEEMNSERSDPPVSARSEALRGDGSARLAAEISERLGRLRSLAGRGGASGQAVPMLQALSKEISTLVSEIKASKPNKETT